MNKKLVVIIIFFTLAFTGFTQTSTNKVAVIIAYTGKVKVIRGNNTLFGKRNFFIQESDYIQTDTTSSAQIFLKNAVKIKILPNSKIMINAITGENNNHYSITHFIGSVISKVERLTNQARYEVNTPTTIAGVRGTNFTSMISIDGSTNIVVEQGGVKLTKKLNEQSSPDTSQNIEETPEQQQTTTEQTVNVNAGQQAEISQESSEVKIKRFQNADNIRKRWIQRRLRIFNKHYPIILNRIHRRIRRGKRLNRRAIRWINRVERRMRRVEPRVERALRQGRPMAIRIIRRRTRRLIRISRRVIRRMRIMIRRIRAGYHFLTNMKNRIPNHPALRHPKYKSAVNLISQLRNDIKSKIPELRSKIRYIRRTARRWNRMTRRFNNRRFRRGRFRRRFRRRFR